MQTDTVNVTLPLNVKTLSDGMLVITCPVARGIFIGCRTVEEGKQSVQAMIDDLAAADRQQE